MVKAEKLHAPGAKISVGFKANGLLTNAVHRAAQSAGAASTSLWLHALVMDAVIDELGITAADLEAAKPAPKVDMRRGKAPLEATSADLDQIQATLQATLMRLAELQAQIKRR